MKFWRSSQTWWLRSSRKPMPTTGRKVGWVSTAPFRGYRKISAVGPIPVATLSSLCSIQLRKDTRHPSIWPLSKPRSRISMSSQARNPFPSSSGAYPPKMKTARGCQRKTITPCPRKTVPRWTFVLSLKCFMSSISIRPTLKRSIKRGMMPL